MALENRSEIITPNFRPQNDGFSRSYKGTWREQGMIATAWLEPAETGRFPRGVYLRGAYELNSTYESSRRGALSTHQEEIGADLARKLRERMQEEMQAAGWEVVAQSQAGLNLWQYSSARTAAAQQTPATSDQGTKKREKARKKREPGQMIEPARRVLSVPGREKVKSYERTITAIDVTLTCARCKKDTTRTVYPGATPQYCEECAKEVEREKTRARVARLRAAKKREVKPVK